MSQARHVREVRFLAPENFPVDLRGGQYQLGLEDITTLPSKRPAKDAPGLVHRVHGRERFSLRRSQRDT